MTSYFYAEGGLIRIKFRRLVQNDVIIVVIWSESKPEVAAAMHLVNSLSWSQSQCHIAGCKNSIRHIENRFSPYCIFWFLNAVWVLASGGFRIVSDTLVIMSTRCFGSSACLQSLSSVLYKTAYGLQSPKDRLGGTRAEGAGHPDKLTVRWWRWYYAGGTHCWLFWRHLA